MRIGIDARFVGPQGTGLGKYTEKLILNLAKIDTSNHFIIFLRKNNWSYLKLDANKNFTKVSAEVPWYSLEEQFKMPAIFGAQNLNLLHVPHFNVPLLYKGKFVVTIHDLIHHKFSEYATTTKNPIIFKLKRIGYKKVIANAIQNSQKILTPSKFVKQDLIKNFKINPSKIVVTYEAAEEEYFNSLPATAKRQPFLIYVGNAYPHKNLERLLDAIKILNVNLVIVCPRDVFSVRLKNEIEKRSLEKTVEIKGYQQTSQLTKLFQKASAYVFPSLSEGFGIPGLNAMASGIPVVASNIPVLKEVYANAAVYFDPNDPRDIADQINKVLSDPKARINLVKRGNTQSKKYSWLQMAEETLRVYETA